MFVSYVGISAEVLVILTMLLNSESNVQPSENPLIQYFTFLSKQLLCLINMFGAKRESVQFRNCPAQSRNSYFVVQFRHCTGTILEQRKGFWSFIEQVKVSAQSGNLWDKVRIEYFI